MSTKTENLHRLWSQVKPEVQARECNVAILTPEIIKDEVTARVKDETSQVPIGVPDPVPIGTKDAVKVETEDSIIIPEAIMIGEDQVNRPRTQPHLNQQAN